MSGVRGRCRKGLLLALSLLGLILSLSPALAAPTSLKLAPEAVTIEANSAATVVVSSDDSGPPPTLQILNPSGIRSRILRAPDAPSPGRPLRWLVELKADPALMIECLVTFELVRNGQPIATGQIKVTPKAGPTVAASVKAELLFDGEALLDGRDSSAFLQLTNLTDYDLTAWPPRPLAPPGIQITSDQKAAATLPARGVLLTRLALSVAPDQVLSSGKHTIGLVVSLVRNAGDLPWSGDVAVSREITAGIPGMTELQSVLQIPSLLLLPGFLIVISFFAARNLGKPAAAGQGAFTRFAFAWSPWLWIAAITLSGIIVFVYPWLTSVFGHVRRNILYGYGMSDLVTVWIGSIGVGIGGGLMVNLWDYVIAQIQGKRRFVPREEPLAFLKRLSRINTTYRFAYVDINGHRLYRLDPAEPGATVWAAPALRYTPRDADFDARPIADALRAGGLEDLRALLGRYTGTGLIMLRWDDFGSVSGPTMVPAESFANLDPQRTDSIVQEQP
jgi:hypothetical protein